MTDRAPGEGWYRGAAISWLVFGGTHLLAIYNANFGTPPNEEYAALEQSLRDYSVQIGPFEPNAWGTTQVLNESYSILLLTLGALNLLIARSLGATGRIRTAAIANLIPAAALFASAMAHQFPPPALFAAVTVGLFTVAAIKAGKPGATLDHART